MSHPAVTCHLHDNLGVPAKLMWDLDCGVIPVVRDDGKLAGMITDRDICMAAYTQGCSLSEIEVSHVMASDPISARPEQSIDEVEHLMAEHQVRRIAVVDEDDRVLGVLSLNDLALEGTRPDTQMKDASARVAHTLAAISAHRSPAPRAQRARESAQPSIEIAPAGWVETFVEPYPLPTATR
jgi:signal-transduction protein with cAMP-binding, CBS, and nucleotidyltransferase domain